MRPALAAAASLLVAFPAAASDCTLAHATYRQGTAVEIQFFPLEGDAAPATTTHLFELHIAGVERPLFGAVETQAGRDRARISRDCPRGTQIGDGSSGCPFWAGQIIAGESKAGVALPDDYGVAPSRMTLSKLGMALARARFDVGPLIGATDVFILKGCSG